MPRSRATHDTLSLTGVSQAVLGVDWVMAAPKLDAKRLRGVRYNQALACVQRAAQCLVPRYNDHDL